MKISDVMLEMELYGVAADDISAIVDLCKSKGINSEMIDDELQKLGYGKIFSVDYDAYDEYDEWEDDEFASVEKFPHKPYYRD